MIFSQVIFYIFAALAVMSAIIVLWTKNILYAAFSLIVTFLCISAVYIYAGAEFVAVAQIMIYVGGILVLMIFGVMLTNKISGRSVVTENHNKLAGLLIGAGVFLGLLYGIVKANIGMLGFGNETPILKSNTIQHIGVFLMSDFILPFEIIAILLLIALIGAAVIAKKEEGADDTA